MRKSVIILIIGLFLLVSCWEKVKNIVKNESNIAGKVETKTTTTTDESIIIGKENNFDSELFTCWEIGNRVVTNICYRDIAIKYHNHTICQKIDDTEMKNTCYKNIALYLKDSSVCDNIIKKDLLEQCYYDVNADISGNSDNFKETSGNSTQNKEELDLTQYDHIKEEDARLANIWIAYYELGNYDKSIEYFKKSIEIAEKEDVPEYYIINLKIKLASVYIYWDKREEGLKYIEKIIETVENSNQIEDHIWNIKTELWTLLVNAWEIEKGRALFKEVHWVDTPE